MYIILWSLVTDYNGQVIPFSVLEPFLPRDAILARYIMSCVSVCSSVRHTTVLCRNG